MPSSKHKHGSYEELAALVARTRRALWSAAASELEESGESIHAFRVLAYLNRKGTRAQCDLATGLAQDPAWVSRQVDALLRGGFVARERDLTDRRRYLVSITAAGKARHAAMRPSVARASERVLLPLSEDERETLCALLQKLV